MSRPLAVLLGMLLFTALAVFCVARHTPRLTERLTAGVGAALDNDGLEWAGATVSGRAVSLSGFAPSQDARQEALAAARAVWGVRRVHDRIQLRPAVFDFSARRVGRNVVLAGNIPDEDARTEMLARAASLFGSDAVIDEMRVSGPAPDGAWMPMARRGLDLIVRLDSGRVRLSNRDVALAGVAANGREQEMIGYELVEELPAGYTSSINITVPAQGDLTPDECAAEFDLLTRGNQVSFETDSARLRPESSPVLNEVVSLARRCPTARIEVQGHTDALGNADLNLVLSRQRALAVADYIVGRGIDARRVAARGFGESQPIATNGTRRGRALNRRIEFKVEG